MSDEKPVPEKKGESMLKSFLSGGVGGACVVLVGHPLDLIKVRMQTGTAPPGSTVLGLFTQTLAKEGLPGLYRGVSAPLVAVAPLFAVSFWGYDAGQRIVRWASGLEAGARLSFAQICVAGGLSAIPATVFMAPSERVKCVLQTSPPGTYHSMSDCAAALYREGGIRSVFRGTLATLLRDCPGSVAWFGVYEWVKLSLVRLQYGEDASTAQLSPVAVMTAGGFAGMACWGVSMPVDVIKSRYQSAPEGTYTGLVDVYTRLVREEGYGALLRGLRPAMIRAFPANAACFLGMEVSKKMLSFLD